MYRYVHTVVHSLSQWPLLFSGLEFRLDSVLNRETGVRTCARHFGWVKGGAPNKHTCLVPSDAHLTTRTRSKEFAV